MWTAASLKPAAAAVSAGLAPRSGVEEGEAVLGLGNAASNACWPIVIEPSIRSISGGS